MNAHLIFGVIWARLSFSAKQKKNSEKFANQTLKLKNLIFTFDHLIKSFYSF